MTTYIEGYFSENEECTSNYPWPKITDNKVCQIFLDKLLMIEDEIYSTNKNGYDNQLVQYLGYSKCRLCNKTDNGSCEFKIVYNGKTYLWTEGIYHYYTEHKVQPTEEFKNVILNYIIN